MGMTREERLEAALRKLRSITGMLAEELDLEPTECLVKVTATSSAGTRTLAEVSLAECFTEADELLSWDPQSV